MYIVTGGTGFIGSNLVAALADRGEEVAVCDWMRTDERWRNLAKHELAALIAPEALLGWLRARSRPIRAIIHMGAISATTETNAALAKLRPLNAYGWSKHVVDRRLARLVKDKAALPPQWAGLKFFNVYGPNEYHKGSMKSVVAQNFARVKAGEPLRLFRSARSGYPDGGQLRDFVYVRDCVDVMLWLLDRPSVSGLFNLGTGKARTWLDLAHALFAAADKPPAVEFVDMPAELREKYQYFTEARMSRLRAAGYDRPFTSLEDGVGDYVRNFLSAADPHR
jgi:ADP-L-glycero-D-manno-heptose 6-epimerase